MDFIAKARKLESRIARSVDQAVEGFVGRSPRQPFEIVQAVLDCVEQQVQSAGRGRRVFPFNRVVIHVLAAARADKAQFEAVSVGPPSLDDRLRERLQAAGCDVAQIDVRVAYASRAKDGLAGTGVPRDVRSDRSAGAGGATAGRGRCPAADRVDRRVGIR